MFNTHHLARQTQPSCFHIIPILFVQSGSDFIINTEFTMYFLHKKTVVFDLGSERCRELSEEKGTQLVTLLLPFQQNVKDKIVCRQRFSKSKF